MIAPTINLPPEEMQFVVNEASFWLYVHSAILYGFMEGELPNQEVCIQWLECGKQIGVIPSENYISPEFKAVDKITGFNDLCQKCKISRRFVIKSGIFICNQCKTEYNP